MSKFASNTIKIIYFNVCAKAEHSKYMLAYKKVNFDCITPNDHFRMPWAEVKANGLVPFGQLPLLLDGDLSLAQTGAIDRYVAQKLGLYPNDDTEAAKVDEIYQAFCELDTINPIVNVYRDEQFAQKKEEFWAMAPPKLLRLAKMLGDAQFFCARTEPSMCDFMGLHILQNILRVESSWLDAQPTLLAYVARCQDLPNLKEYLKSCHVPVDIGTKPKLAPQSI